MHRRTVRTIAGGAILAFVVGACGQKPGVHVEGGVGGAAPLAQGDTTVDTGGVVTTDEVATDGATTGPDTSFGGGGDTGAPADTSGGADPATPSSDDGGDGGDGTTTGGPAPAPGTAGGGDGGEANDDGGSDGGQQPQSNQGRRPVTGNDRTGITADKMTFASHAPVTGAAPLPTTSFEKSGDIYWRNLIELQGQTVLGRTEIELLFRDDKYDPNSARQVCRELAARAFTVSGGGGTDQIQACGQFAEVAELPYFSAGVTEAGLRDNPWYFAASMSYRQQGPLLAQMVKKYHPGKKAAAIVTDTPNFDDAVEGWEQGVQEQGLDYFRTLRHPKGDTSWYNAFAGELQEAGVEVLYILSSPVDYIRFAQQASQSGRDFQYVGVGVSMGLNAVLGSGCDHVDGGMFFSPFPGLDYGRQHVPEFFETAERFDAPADDIALGLWGTNEVLHQLLLRYERAYGTDLTREDFRDLVEGSTGVETKVFPPLNYSADDHFGSKAVHLLRANCATVEYETVESFASGF